MFMRILRGCLRLVYRVRVTGLEHYAEAGPRVLIVANHSSFLDGLLLAAFLPDRLTFAVDTYIARRWWVRPFLKLVDVLTVNPANPYSIKSLIRYLEGDRKAVIFPEGRITVTGSLMKIYHGPGLVADKSGAMLLPVRIDGAQYTPFSRLRGRVRLRWFPQIRLTILPPRPLRIPAEVRGRDRRRVAGRVLADIMTEMMFVTSPYRQTLVQALLDARRLHGGGRIIAEDIERQPISYDQLLVRAFVLGRMMATATAAGERVGVLLPNTLATLYTFFGLQLYRRVPAMLNYSAGAQAVLTACQVSGVRTVYTSRRFIEAARLPALVERLAEQLQVVYLEDLRAQLGIVARLRGWLAGRFARLASYAAAGGGSDPHAPAVVLFTSGSEGQPKGVALSHANLLANYYQIAARVDFSANDVVLNALPLFHSFGLTAGTLLPLAAGMRMFLYPSPLHYRIVPEIAYDINATVMFGTNTFLAGYARYAHPYDFYSLRYVFAGAEKLKDETRRVWMERFGVRVMEGYGATETSPVLAINTAMDYRPGTVGRLLPAVELRLDPVPGIEQGGRLSVRGPNIMLGYYKVDRPGVLMPPATDAGGGWYDTGDIVSVDDDGFVTIAGRARRFAKIGGEMVSLTAAEELASRAWPDAAHAIVALADSQKGEQLVLVTTHADAERGAMLTCARTQGVPELCVPRRIVCVLSLPLLGSGKIDYPAVQALAEAGS